jgi:allantoin racemase
VLTLPRILVISPDVNDPWIDSDKKFFPCHAQKGTSVDVVDIEYGPEGNAGGGLFGLIGEIFVVKQAMWAEKQGYDAMIVNCFADPGVRVARHVVRIPVIGAGEATLHVASILGHRISILGPGDPTRHLKPGQPIIIGDLKFEIASRRYIGLMTDIQKDVEKSYSIFLEKTRECIEEDDAHVIVFGCTVMSFDKVAERLQKELGIPVLDASSTALAVAELLVNKNLSHSPKAYPRARADAKVILPNDLRWAIDAKDAN